MMLSCNINYTRIVNDYAKSLLGLNIIIEYEYVIILI